MHRLWLISRICEDFHCLPDQAEALWLDDEQGRVAEILTLRSYALAKAEYDMVGGKIEQLDRSPVMDEVIQNYFRLQKRSHADG